MSIDVDGYGDDDGNGDGDGDGEGEGDGDGEADGDGRLMDEVMRKTKDSGFKIQD